MARACHECQASKIGRHTKAPLSHFDPPDRRFGDTHVDLVGPLPSSEDCNYLLTIVDRFTRWPEAIPLPNAEAVTCAKALLRTWIARFGVPDTFTSDQGRQFTSSLWRELNMVLGVKPQTTIAYHPQANGMVERFHRSLKTALKARLDGPRWMDELPIVMLGIRTTWKEDLDAAPVLLTYGTNLRVPGDFLPPPCADKVSPSSAFVQEMQEKLRKLSLFPPSHHGSPAPYIPKNLQSADQVYLRHDARKGPLVRPYDGPFPVLTRADKHFDISTDGKAVRVSLDRLKPACSPQTFPRLNQDPCVSEQQDPHALQEDHTAIMGDAVGPDRAATFDDDQGIAPAPAPSSLSDASPPQVTTRSGRLVQKPKKYRTFYRLS